MNTHNRNAKTTFAKHFFAAAALIGIALTATPLMPAAAAPAISLPRTAACGLNPAASGWVPMQVSMEYEARCAGKGGALAAPAKAAPKVGCSLNPAAQGWVPMQVTMEYETRCK
jgi:hypothetical protein